MENKVQKISGASFILTEGCNLNCTYCFEGKMELRDAKKVMTKEVSEAAIDFLIRGCKENKTNTFTITYFGGEPLLNIPVLIHSFRYAIKRSKEENVKFHCSVITNGTIFTDEWSDFLKEWYDALGYIDVQISIDGIPMVQDTNRVTITGKGSSKKVESVVKKYEEALKKHGIDRDKFLHVHGVISKFSLPYMYEGFKYLKEDLGFEGVWFMPCHEEPWDEKDVEIFRSEVQKISDYILQECINTNSSLPFRSYSSIANCKTKFPSAPCGAGKSYATVTHNGDIHPCHAIYFADKSLKFGNVFEGEDPSKRQFFLDYGSENMFGDQPCHDCGNASCYRCIAVNYINNGNFLVGFPNYCKMSRVEDEIRRELTKKLEELGIMNDPFGKNASSSCQSCNTVEKEEPGLDMKFMKTLVSSIEDSLIGINNNASHNSKSIDLLNEKIDALMLVVNSVAEVVLHLASKEEGNA